MKRKNDDFWETLRRVNKALDIIRDHCIGCKRLVKEGSHAYEETIPCVNGICPKCGRKRYKKSEND